MKSKLSRNKIGIVILNYNGSEVSILTLQSLISAKSRVNFEVILIDNASEEDDEKKLNAYFKDCLKSGKINGQYIKNTHNLGFSGACNQGTKIFLKDRDVSHICYLNSDVVVTDYWLDDLVKNDFDMVGPVTNAAGNDQTVPIDFELSKTCKDFPTIQSYANYRKIKIGEYIHETDFLIFFCVLIKREIIEDIGLLDEQFFPGSFEDNDFCKRAIISGYKLYVNRAVYIHHWGSGSFSKLAMEDRINISNTNMVKFEEKWNEKFLGMYFKLLDSCQHEIDMALEQNKCDQRQKNLIATSLKDTRELFKIISAQNAWFEADARKNKNNYIGNPSEISAKEAFDILKKKVKRRLNLSNVSNLIRRVKGKTRSNLDRLKVKVKFYRHKYIPIFYKHVIINALKNRISGKSIVIFAPMFSTERLKDGYFKRISEIDKILSQNYKIYINTEFHKQESLQIEKKGDGRVYIAFYEGSLVQKIQVAIIVFICGKTYTHSILQVYPKVYNIPLVKRILDVHGAVPEEFRLHGDYLNGQLYEDKEDVAIRKSNVIICVNEAMKEHLVKKYNKKNKKYIIMPIIDISLDVNIDLINSMKDKSDKIIIYAGGIQKWQQIDKMMSVISKQPYFKYKIFVPLPQVLKDMYDEHLKIERLIVDTRNSEDLILEYYKSHYGFLLRENIIVNNVACPTKLIEYIQALVVPIFETNKVGDFSRLGLEFISVEDFSNGNLPNEEERISMSIRNLQVLREIQKQFEIGSKQLEGEV